MQPQPLSTGANREVPPAAGGKTPFHSLSGTCWEDKQAVLGRVLIHGIGWSLAEKESTFSKEV